MNLKSPVAAKLKNIDRSKAEISFQLFPQNVNEEGFVERFLNERVEFTPVWLNRSGEVIEGDDGRGAILGFQAQVKVEKKAAEPEPEEKPAAPAKKKATPKRASGSKESE